MLTSKPIHLDNEIEYIAPNNRCHELVQINSNVSKVCFTGKVDKPTRDFKYSRMFSYQPASDEQAEYLIKLDSLKKTPIILKFLAVA